MSVEINVRGAHSVTLPPERGTVHAALTLEGPQAEPVFAALTAALAEVKGSIEALHHPKKGPVTWYSFDQVRLGSRRPWHKDGKQLPLVYSAAVSIAAKFRDFEELARWVSWAAGVEGLSVSYVEWALTESKRLKVERATRQQAVRDAQRRAQDYADALDLGKVVVRAISDPGMGRPAPAARAAMMAHDVSLDGVAPEFELRPEEVEIGAHVEAVFTVASRK